MTDLSPAARRPKPPSLKEQALVRTAAILNDPNRALLVEVRDTLELALRALEALAEAYEAEANNPPERHPDPEPFQAILRERAAALAQPEPQGARPTNEELLGIEDLEAAWNAQADASNSWDELGLDEIVCWAQQQALARWGRPAQSNPVPVSERLPVPEDCDPSLQCWWFTPSEEKWIFWPIKWAGPECSHWLPHHALPVPQQEATND